MENTYGIDIEQYLLAIPLDAPVPRRLVDWYFTPQTHTKADIATLTFGQIMRVSVCDMAFFRRLLRLLNAMGVNHVPEGDVLIYDIEDIPIKLQRDLVCSGYYTKRDILHIPEQKLCCLKRVSHQSTQYIQEWQKRHFADI